MSETDTGKPVEDERADEPAEESGREQTIAGEEEAEAEAPVEAASDAVESPRPTSRGMLSGLVPKLAIAVAVVAVLIASALWWQYRQFYVELDSYDAYLLENLEATRASLRLLEDEIAALRSEAGARDAELDDIGGDLEVLPAELRALSRRVEALQGGQLDARDTWLREQAEYYLVLANTELDIGGRVGSAIAALELADDLLRDLGDPALIDVRGAIASELQDLRSVPGADLERLAADLGSLIERSPTLPMRAAAPENFGAPQESLEDVEPGLERLLARTRGAVTSIVRIERQDEPVGPLLTETERQIVRRQLALELQLARTAVLERRESAFRASLVAADGILNRDFQRSAAGVIEARRLLGEMMNVELAPDLPEIGDSLMLLRATGA